MTYREHYDNIEQASRLVINAINDLDLDLETSKLLHSKLSFLIENLNYWVAHGNEFRYHYDLKHFILWVLETFQ